MNDMLREQARIAVNANQSLKEDLRKAHEELRKFAQEREMERSLARLTDEVRLQEYEDLIYFISKLDPSD